MLTFVDLSRQGFRFRPSRSQPYWGVYSASKAALEALAADIVRMLSPDFSETGTLFDFPSGKMMSLLGA